MFQPVVVAAALVDDLENPTRLLGAQRSYPEKWRGFFEFPGGKTEPGETPEQTLVRELREELRAEILIGKQLPGVWSAHGGFDMFVYLAKFAPGSIPQIGKAHLSLEWVDFNQPQQLQWLPADEPILTALQKYAQGLSSEPIHE